MDELVMSDERTERSVKGLGVPPPRKVMPPCEIQTSISRGDPASMQLPLYVWIPVSSTGMTEKEGASVSQKAKVKRTGWRDSWMAG